MKVGFIGLGDMGQGITASDRCRHTVTGWNRTIEKAAPLLQIGMAWADSPARSPGVPRRSYRSSPTPLRCVKWRLVMKVIAGLRPDSVYLDMSTIDPGVPIDRRRLRRRWSDHARRPLSRAARSRWLRGRRRSWSEATGPRSSGLSRCCSRSVPR